MSRLNPLNQDMRDVASVGKAQRVFGYNITNLPLKIPLPKKAEPTLIDPIKLTLSNNPQKCTVYEKEIHTFMRDIEAKYMSKANYMTMQPDINEKMRAILTDWMVDVHLKFKLAENTLFLSVNVTDRFLERETVPRQKLQLVGVTAMFIASKYEEIYPPEVKDFVYICDNAYTKEEILCMEQRILKALNFALNFPSSFHFLQYFTRKLNPGSKAYSMSLYLVELSLTEYKFVKHKPSLCAAAALYLSNRLINKDAEWDGKVGEIIGYREVNLKQCAKELVTIMQVASASTLDAVRKKFALSEYMKVSGIRVGRRS
eukprot:TRINITY_DN14924_c0_g2_i1.p1 TRINITY_DN14924_c0_g2~~TRINITY_DN14924_c0_g2_i1.p1  ORF type:complete len:315 (+),score=78.45 TRINITY_DN14924_c0_g2_i1:53-997(+)